MNALCDDCQMRPATVQLQQVNNNVKIEKSLCQVCVQRYAPGVAFGGQMMNPAQIMQMMPQFMQMMPQMMQMMPQMMQMMQAAQQQQPVVQAPQMPVVGGLAHLRCEHCGYSLENLRQTSMLGCPACYGAFAPQMQTLLRRAQGGAVQHNGKVPSRWRGKLRVTRQIEVLRGQLEDAVQQERFEDAARLRDEIRALKSPEDEA